MRQQCIVSTIPSGKRVDQGKEVRAKVGRVELVEWQKWCDPIHWQFHSQSWELEPKDYWQWQGQSFTAHTVFLSAFSQVGPCLLLAEIATCEPISSAQPVCSSSPLSNEPVASCCIGPWTFQRCRLQCRVNVKQSGRYGSELSLKQQKKGQYQTMA